MEGQFHFRAGFRLKNPEVCRSVEKFGKLEGLKGASWGLVIRNAADGSILAEKSSRENFIPASNMKLLTSLNAFHFLGEDYRFETEILSDGILENGVLKGNLWIRGSGDPTIAAPDRDKFKAMFFSRLNQLLREKGIRKINGRILLMEDENPYEGIQKDWAWGDVGNYYGAGIYQYNINENQFHSWIEAKREGAGALLRRKDSLSGGILLDRVRIETTAPGSPDLASYFWNPGSARVSLTGSIPQNSDLQRVKGSLQNPPELFLKVLVDEVRKSGVVIENEEAPRNAKTSLGKIASPSLREIVAEVNMNSHNLFTEALSYALCQKSDRCLENGWTHLERFTRLTGFPEGSYLADGSGLSLSNRISPFGLSQALVWALRQKWSDAFLNSLPVAGESGTMKNFCKAAKGKIRAKSGTLTRTLCYSGYAETKKGKIVFSLMVNNYHGPFREMKAEVGNLLESFTGIH